MQVTKTKVQYTEVEILLPVSEVLALVAKHIGDSHNVEAGEGGITPLIVESGDGPARLTGFKAVVLKRGRAVRHANGKKYAARAAKDVEPEPEPEPEEKPKKLVGKPKAEANGKSKRVGKKLPVPGTEEADVY